MAPSESATPTSWVEQLGQSGGGLDLELRGQVADALDEDELVYYAGQPSWRAELPTLLLTSGFGVGLLAISGFFAWRTGEAALGLAPFHFDGVRAPPWVALVCLLMLLPLLSIGAACAAAPLTGPRRSRRTLHIVTNRRILTVTAGLTGGATSFRLGAVTIVKCIDQGGGRGTITLAHGVYRDPDGQLRPDTTTWYGIPHVAQAAIAIAHRSTKDASR